MPTFLYLLHSNRSPVKLVYLEMMASEEHLKTDDDVEAILKLAIRKSSSSPALRERLQMSAEELGISPEQLAQAEQEYYAQKERQEAIDKQAAIEKQEKKEFRRTQMRDLMWHLGSYLTVNAFLVFIDMVEDFQIDWAYYPLFGWGIGMVFHIFSLFDSTENEDEFRKWKRRRARHARPHSGSEDN